MRLLKIAALLLLAQSSLMAVAKDEAKQSQAHDWATGRSKGYAYRYVTGDPMETRFYKLSNGLTVILSPTHNEPRIHFFIAVKAGSKTDPANHTGLAHYLEHMMFKGTDQYGTLDWEKEEPLLTKINNLYEDYNHTKDEKKRAAIYHVIDSVSGEAAKFAIANEYDKMMTAIGAQGTNAFTSVEQTVYTEDIPANAVDKFLKVQAERFRNPVFRIFHTELEAVYEEKNRSLDNDNEKAEELILGHLFRNHNYGKQTTIGTIEHLKNPSLAEIRKYYNTYYVPNNMGIVVAGDFDPDVMIRKIDDHFSKMRSHDVPKYTFKPEEPIAKPIEKEVVGPDAEFVAMGFRMPGVHDKDALVAEITGQMLTNGRAGLIDLNLVKKQKLLRASASTDIMIDYGYMYLNGVATSGQKLEDVKELMLGEIENLKKGRFDEDLLTSIVNNQKKAMMQITEKYGARAYTLMNAVTCEEDWKDDVDYIERISRLRKKDIVDFANKYFKDNYVAVYKRKGEDKNLVKVQKPPITPVETNAKAQSEFVKLVAATPVDPVEPKWVDYNTDMSRGNVGPAEILYVHNDVNSLFRMSYRYGVGTWSDRKLAIAAQYLQFLGTGKKSAEDISREFYKLACSFSVRADNEFTTVSIEGLQENFDKAVALFEDLLANCRPDEEALASLKARIAKARADAKNNKQAIMQGLVNYARYGAANPFNNVLSMDELNGLTSAEMVDMLHNLSDYSHRVLYYGPMPLSGLTSSLKKSHRLPTMFRAAPAPKVFTFTEQTGNDVLFADYDMVQAEVRWVRNIPGYRPESQPCINLFNNYFGGNMGAVVFQTIRESKALAYSTNAYVATPDRKEDPYYVSAYVGCQADKFSESIKAMNELLNDLPALENNFQTARTGMKKDLETERITQDGIIRSYLDAERKGLTQDIRKTIYESADRLRYEDLKKLHLDDMAGKPFTYCIVASEKKMNMDAVKDIGKFKKLSLEEIFGY